MMHLYYIECAMMYTTGTRYSSSLIWLVHSVCFFSTQYNLLDIASYHSSCCIYDKKYLHVWSIPDLWLMSIEIHHPEGELHHIGNFKLSTSVRNTMVYAAMNMQLHIKYARSKKKINTVTGKYICSALLSHPGRISALYPVVLVHAPDPPWPWTGSSVY